MTYYRLHSNLTYSGKILNRGSINRLDKLSNDAISKLLKSDVISIVSFPPLTEIPSFEEKSELLEWIGIADTNLFLDLCSCDLGLMLNLPDLVIESWQNEVLDSVKIIDDDGCKCGDSRSLKKK